MPPELSAGGLDGSLPQISACLGNLGIPSAPFSLTPVLFSQQPTVIFLHEKRLSRPRSPKGLHKREKYQISPILKTQGIMRTRRMTIEQGRRVGISRFPNFHKSGSIRGMKRLYYGKDCLLVRCGSYIYNISTAPRIYYQATI